MNFSTTVIVATVVASVLVSALPRLRTNMNLEQWSVGDRAFGTVFVFLLMAGESFTTFTVLGASGFAYGRGGAVYYILAYECLAYTLSFWLSPAIWRYAKRHRLVSLPDFLRKKYDSRALGVIAATVGIVALIPYIVLQLKGMAIIVSTASSNALSPASGIVLGAVAITINVMLSGVHGSAWVSSVKDIVIVLLVVFLGIYLPIHYYGGIHAMFTSLEASKPGFTAIAQSGFSPVWFASTIILSTLGFFMWPHVFAATFTSGNVAVLRRNACLLPAYSLLLALVFFVGFTAVGVVPGLSGAQADLSLFKLAMGAMPEWFIALLGAAGALCAIVPGSMLVLTTSILFSRDLVGGFGPPRSDRFTVSLAKLAVPVIMTVCVSFALSGSQTVVALLLMGYNFVTQLAPAFFASLLHRNPATTRGSIAGVAAGMLCVASISLTGTRTAKLLPFLPASLHDVNVGAVALTVNILVFAVVSLMDRFFPASRTSTP
ncbi:sodium:solute symporter family protein [Paraburkholderia sp. SOS3]|uniref:sodium:solute symporter family protein n=1 Tax=Paraburkholderia sp. SOS3 TaxID=1926494 RepID=UPI000947660E|nr:sodium:solute symporter family protein [Paraburkholderia sp. SOS3]APR35690.1 sodium:solute symporter [Paraburkholderia sp. SOS3]